VGSQYGEFTGPATGAFAEWVTCYKCQATTSNDTALSPLNTNSVSTRAIPCGQTLTASRGQHSLSETRKDHVFKFAINGEMYVPVEFHVTHGCTCRFYTYVYPPRHEEGVFGVRS
jgi:hypothetical protein